MRRSVLLLTALLLAAATAAPPKPAPAPSPAADARAVARKVLEAHGGQKGLDRALNRGMQAGRIILYQTPRSEGTFTAWANGEQRRTEYHIGDMQVTEIFNGERGWKVTGGNVTAYTDTEIVNARDQNHTGMAALLQMLSDPTTRVTLTEGEYDGARLTGLRITQVNGLSTLLLFDPKTNLVRVQETTVKMESGGRTRLRAVLDDYRPLPDGTVFPYHNVIYLGLPKSFEVFIEKVDLKAETPATLFAPPAKAPN